MNEQVKQMERIHRATNRKSGILNVSSKSLALGSSYLAKSKKESDKSLNKFRRWEKSFAKEYGKPMPSLERSSGNIGD